MSDLRIHPDNAPLLKLPVDHPAHIALIIHAECANHCVGREIPWPDSPDKPIDHTWYSAMDQRIWTFSGFAYSFISFDLVLDGWINGQTHLQPFEQSFLEELPRLRGLLAECECSAKADSNTGVLPLIKKTNEFFFAFERSIIARVGQVHVDSDQAPGESLWSSGRTYCTGLSDFDNPAK